MTIDCASRPGGGVVVEVKFETSDGLELIKLGAALEQYPSVHLAKADPYSAIVYVNTLRSPELVKSEILKEMRRRLRS